jgi:predicted Rossmann-fold nucleotide-binding protein
MAPNTLRPPTIAIFGGNDAPTEVASSVAEAIAKSSRVVLTGGDGKDHDGVKGQALLAARQAGGAWIGVPRGRKPPPSSSRPDRGLLLRAEIGHRRNLFEAWLSDAAVVFEGGLGTVSECVSSLCLGRPVLLVGRTWVERRVEYVGLPMLFGEDAVPDEHLQRLVDDTKTKLGDGKGPMSTEVSEVIDLARLKAHHSLCRHIENPDDVAPILKKWVAKAARNRLGHFPHGAGLDELEPDYDDWWASLA